jgi:hypothetical protein
MNELAGENPARVCQWQARKDGVFPCMLVVQLFSCKDARANVEKKQKPTFVKQDSSKDEPTLGIKADVRETNQR